MMTASHIFNSDRSAAISRQLFLDINLDRLLSEDTIKAMQSPCSKDEILLRQEVFRILDDGEKFSLIENCLNALSEEEHNYHLWKTAETKIESLFLQCKALRSYAKAENALATVTGCGEFFCKVSEYFSSDERKQRAAEIEEDMEKVQIILQKISRVLISFSAKSMLTPDSGTQSEVEKIAEYAEKLGFTVPDKKELRQRIPISLSDSMIELFPAETTEIESIFDKYSGIDFSEHRAYIPEIKFFFDVFTLTQKAKNIGVQTCFPVVCDEKIYSAKDVYDISLLAKNCDRIVPNDIDFTEKEPFFYLVGANGGGKTTYLRAVAINLILFISGCPVFAKEAKIYPFKFTAAHFPKDERFDETGRLDEELKRANEMLSDAENKDSFLFFNETFSGTDEQRGIELLKEISEKIKENMHFGLYVTHFHEVTGFDAPILSAQVDISDDNKRTFKVVKSKGTASSYAADILKKYGLDKESLLARRGKR